MLTVETDFHKAQNIYKQKHYLLLSLSVKRYTICSELRNLSALVIGFSNPWALADAIPISSKISDIAPTQNLKQ